MARKPRTLNEVITALALQQVARENGREKASYRDLRRALAIVGRVGSLIVMWVAIAKVHGEELTPTRFIELSGEPERSVYLHLAEFRALFGDVLGERATPQVFVPLLGRRDEVNALSVDVTPLLA